MTILSDIEVKYEALKNYLTDLESVIVAFSGGVDSSLVAFVANEVLGDKALAVTSGSESLKREDLLLTQKLADEWSLPHKIIHTKEIKNKSYSVNPTNRCYYCKSTLYRDLQEVAEKENFRFILNGTNLDDLGDFRPGLTAAQEFHVKSPLVDCHFKKKDVRQLAERLKLKNAKKPQAACLSSRVPYGTEISIDMLKQIERAETVLNRMGLLQCRVRHHGEVARLEVPISEFEFVIQYQKDIVTRIKNCGYLYVTLDLEGFRSGSLNDGILRTKS